MRRGLKNLSTICSLILFCAQPKMKVQGEIQEKFWSEFKGKMKWSKAYAACRSSGMRLPTIAEFQSIYFHGFKADWKRDSEYYWTNNEREGGRADIFDLTFGASNSYPKDYANYGVRCVNGDKKASESSGKAAAARAENWSNDLGPADWYTASRKCALIGMKLPLRSDLYAAYEAQLSEIWLKEVKGKTSGEYWTAEEYSSDQAYVMYHHWAKHYPKSSSEKYPGVIDVIGGNHTEFHFRCIHK